MDFYDLWGDGRDRVQPLQSVGLGGRGGGAFGGVSRHSANGVDSFITE